MAAELLETLPSIPADVDASNEAEIDEAEPSTAEAPYMGAEAAVYNRVALP